LAQPFVVNPTIKSDSTLEQKIITVRDNVETLSRINHYLEVYFLSTEEYKQRFVALSISDIEQKVIAVLDDQIKEQNDWNLDVVKQVIEGIMNELSLGKGKVMKPLRKALTGYESGPNLVDCLAQFSLETMSERIAIARAHVNTTASN
jgi:glutamyl/glutaminyl-tRNA synthetase